MSILGCVIFVHPYTVNEPLECKYRKSTLRIAPKLVFASSPGAEIAGWSLGRLLTATALSGGLPVF